MLLRKSSGAAVAAACGLAWTAAAEAAEKPSLTVFWHAGDLADAAAKIAAQYTAETGVEVAWTTPPLTEAYYTQIADEFARHGPAFDLCIFDSQSMSEFASAGHVLRLDDLLAASESLHAADFDQAALQRYGEYPEGSGHLYALPMNQDCMGLVHREDLLGDPAEQKAFLTRYGHPLGVPRTWDELRDVAEFFTRPEQDLYGIALYGSAEYDACTTAFNNVLWSFGAELWDPRTGRVEGAIDSAAAKRALAYFKELFRFAPPGFTNAYVPEVNGAIAQGRVALGVQWYYYFPELADRGAASGHRLGFGLLPGEKGEEGVVRRHAMVGGQGISINRYSRHQTEAWRFLEWFMSPERQRQWVSAGGRTGLASILSDPGFAKAAPGNDTFARCMSTSRDYWHLPEYARLLAVYQKHVHAAIRGEENPSAALDACAKEQDALLEGHRRRLPGGS